jgi:hypothetical protein
MVSDREQTIPPLKGVQGDVPFGHFSLRKLSSRAARSSFERNSKHFSCHFSHRDPETSRHAALVATNHPLGLDLCEIAASEFLHQSQVLAEVLGNRNPQCICK